MPGEGGIVDLQPQVAHARSTAVVIHVNHSAPVVHALQLVLTQGSHLWGDNHHLVLAEDRTDGLVGI